MLRKVYLEGDIARRFGHEFELSATSFKEVFNCLQCNFPDFRQYILDCHEKDVGFTFVVAGEALKHEEQLLMNLQPGDMVISSIPAGSKSGAGKIFAAIAIVVVAIYAPQLLGQAGFGQGLGVINTGTGAAGFGFAAGSTGAFLQTAAYALAVNLALAGLQQVMAPDPATDKTAPQSYLFNGSEQNIVEGDPVPILYGELRVPGQPISFESLTVNTSNLIADRDHAMNTDIIEFNMGQDLGSSKKDKE